MQSLGSHVPGGPRGPEEPGGPLEVIPGGPSERVELISEIGCTISFTQRYLPNPMEKPKPEGHCSIWQAVRRAFLRI